MKEKEILKGTKIIGLGLYFKKEKLLAISDLHLGYEEMLNKQGVFVPRTNFDAIKKQLRAMLKETGKLDTIIILGDLKHEFGTISKQEWREVLEMLQFLQRKTKKIVLLKGNHDKILGPLAQWEKIEIQEELYITDLSVLFLHGDKIPENKNFEKSKTLVIGHEHPAVSLRDSVKSETFKCFLKGKFEEKNLIVLPSLNSVSVGSNVLREKNLSPFLKGELGNFECWLVEDCPYYFGKLADLK